MCVKVISKINKISVIVAEKHKIKIINFNDRQIIDLMSSEHFCIFVRVLYKKNISLLPQLLVSRKICSSFIIEGKGSACISVCKALIRYDSGVFIEKVEKDCHHHKTPTKLQLLFWYDLDMNNYRHSGDRFLFIWTEKMVLK